MIIKYVNKNIFDAKEKFILHGVNAQGVIGRGLSAEMARLYPYAMVEYVENTPSLGNISIVHCDDKSIIHAVINDQYGSEKMRYVNYEAVARCMEIIEERLYGETIAMPLIGLGYTYGNWNIMAAIIENSLQTVKPVIYVKSGKYETT